MSISTPSLNPSVSVTVALGLLLTAILSAVYLFNPGVVQDIQFKLTDTIAASAPPLDNSDTVVVVDIDESALEAWGQWPWPRSRLAVLLDAIAAMGARSVALDFIMAEPDRTSTRRLPGWPADQTDGVESHQDNDARLAQTLARGPYVLGFEFTFDVNQRSKADCPITPLDVVNVRPASADSGAFNLFHARDVVCNIPRLVRAAPRSGFLNGQPDRDGRLRRLPLMIAYEGAIYPSLALAALAAPPDVDQAVRLEVGTGGQGVLVVGGHTIPIDSKGNLRIRFAAHQAELPHISAHRILSGQVAATQIHNRVVLVGLTAAGLAPTYQAPTGERFSAVDIQAQAVETILSGRFIRRHQKVIVTEVIVAMVLALFFSLGVSRLSFLATAAIGAGGIAAAWLGPMLLFESRHLLFSPLLPMASILICGPLLMLFKYWTRQRRARLNLHDALILMKRSEQNLNAIIQTIPDIVFRLDSEGHITFISPAIAKYQTQPETLIGKPILDLVVPEDKERATWRINERRTGKRATTNLEVRLKLALANGDADDRQRYFSVSTEGIYSEPEVNTHSFLGTQGIARDINQRKQLEHRLEQSKQMEAMGNLAAGVAHDLNNILSGLVSYPELLLLDLPPDSPMREKIETIQHSGQRAADIVQDMLMIARRGVKNHEIIDINDTINSYLCTPEHERLVVIHPELRLKTRLADDLMNVRGSAVHLSKVIMNLVGNAAEAMPAGGSVSISTCNRYLDTAVHRYEKIPEGEYVLLTVTDDGVGIPAAEFKRIFEPFYSKKRMGSSGSGLGMTVVWNTVKDHAGFVDIDSREGEGSRFDVYLPATREADMSNERRIVLQDYTGTEHILIVDDIPEQLDIAVRMLGKLGYHVASASGGEAAIAFLEDNPVDLVVLDMVMPPGIDGLETYRRILQVRPHQKAIIASGYAPSERVKAMQESGAGEYIRKPYTMEKIGLAVRRELDRQ